MNCIMKQISFIKQGREFGLFDLAQGIKQETLFVQLGSSGCILGWMESW